MSFRASIVSLSLGCLVFVIGCTTTSEEHQNNKLVAYAASTKYPSNYKADNATGIGVIVEPAAKQIRIANFTKYTLNDAEVWVNYTYVNKADTIPAMGYTRLDLGSFFDGAGHSLGGQEVRVDTVQIRTNDHLWTLLGPITQ